MYCGVQALGITGNYRILHNVVNILRYCTCIAGHCTIIIKNTTALRTLLRHNRSINMHLNFVVNYCHKGTCSVVFEFIFKNLNLVYQIGITKFTITKRTHHLKLESFTNLLPDCFSFPNS